MKQNQLEKVRVQDQVHWPDKATTLSGKNTPIFSLKSAHQKSFFKQTHTISSFRKEILEKRHVCLQLCSILLSALYIFTRHIPKTLTQGKQVLSNL